MAGQGDSKSQLNAGIYYRNRGSNDQDLEEAIKWLQRSGLQGNVDANKLLAHHYLNGIGVEINRELAIRFYTSAAEAGDTESQEMLGLIYAQEEDFEKSVEWYVFAAKNGRVQSQIKCISIYGIGLGVECNRVEAYAWALVLSDGGEDAHKKKLEPLLSAHEKARAYKRYWVLLKQIKSAKHESEKRS
jgi:TPR repeat protein